MSLATSLTLQVLVLDSRSDRGLHSWAVVMCTLLLAQSLQALQVSLWIHYTARALHLQLQTTPPVLFTHTFSASERMLDHRRR